MRRNINMLRSIVVFCEILLILNFLTSITCQSSYTVIAPGNIRSNRKYTVSVTLHNVSQPVKFLIGIRDDISWSYNKSVFLQPMETKLLEFFPPKLTTLKNYELFVEGAGGSLSFSNSTQLEVGRIEGLNIFMETDRGAYRPGDLVHFRVVILDEHSKPVKVKEPIKVQIFDSMGNRVKQFKDISLNQGVYTNVFQLSKDPLLGSWSLKVFIAGRYAQENSAAFEVSKYILPKFFVNIETDSQFLFKENRFLNITVYGRYTYNKPVEGKVELRIIMQHVEEVIAYYETYTENSKAIFAIDYDDFKGKASSNILTVNASLTEMQTGVVQSAITEITILGIAHTIELVDNEMEFKDGKPYRIKVSVQHWNKTAVTDSEASVFMHMGGIIATSKLNENGVATFEGEFNAETPVLFSYKGTVKNFYIPLLAGVAGKESNCNMRIKNKSPQINKPIDILVDFEKNIPYLVYIFTSHGNILKSEFVPMEANRKSYTIQLLPGNEMVPKSFLYVHFVYGGELTFCEIKIEIPGKLENEISVSAPKDVRPGENIAMTFKTKPNSRIAITAVDLSSMLVNKRNRLQKSNVIARMFFDVSYTPYKYILHPGTISGLLTLTDIPYSAVNYREAREPLPLESNTDLQIRSYFPETWIFLDVNVTNALTTINFTLPDTITTWVLSAFSMNEKSGIDLLDSDFRITSTKQFFISTHLPYSIKRGEVVSILIVVFNYHSKSLSTEVAMENKLNEFKFVDDLSNASKNSVMEKRKIMVPANNGKSVNFLIKAQKLGRIDIIVQATNELSSDKVLQKLLVEPDGIESAHNQELYIHLKPDADFKTSYKPEIPEDIESDTEFLQLSASGDIILPSFENLDKLVDMPTGCGEQNMIHFAPDILVLEYLSATGQTAKFSDLARKAQQYTEIGYQQELKFRHSDGGYSVFGPRSSKTPSNWLTAYVVRFFIKAMKYLPIEKRIIESSLEFLAGTQLPSGEFKNAGYLFNKVYKGSNSFTAFVLLSFLENPKYAKKYKSVIEKGLNFLSGNIDEIKDIYSLAIMSSVFQIAKHEKASAILEKVRPLAKTKNGLQWWQDDSADGGNAVEITSYILLAIMHTAGSHLPVVKWLIEQRNSHGGFNSTQDTVIGLQALINFAQLSSSQGDTLIKVVYKALDGDNKELANGVIGLDPETAETLQNFQLPSSTRTLDIEMSGTGNIFLQFSYNYRKPVVNRPLRLQLSDPRSFIVKSNAESEAHGLKMILEICIQYKPRNDANHLSTNMIIAEVDLPSGYAANEESLTLLRSSEDVDRLENEIPGKITFYFTYIKADEEKCIDFVADNKHDVRNLKPAKIVVYEYYHSDQREVVTYKIK